MFTDNMEMFGLPTDVLSTRENSEPFYRIANNDGKVWLIPVRNMRTAMNLYQPSGRNGKLLKALFPLLYRLPFPWGMLNMKKIQCSLSDNLYSRLCKLFDIERLEFAVFCGTPCVHQKLTIQLSLGDKILGYCKISDNPEVNKMFVRESDILTHLHNCGIRNIPEPLYAGEWYDGISLFVQSTCKTNQSLVEHEWGTSHEAFLNNLCATTRQKLQFEQTDYYHTLTELCQHLSWLPSDDMRTTVKSAINKVIKNNSGKEVEYCAYHADFTPWNMFVESGRLFVFDWEYAGLTYPPLLDRYHFFTQTAVFERRWMAKEIVDFMLTPDASWINKETYILYLLDVVARFTTREKGNVTGDMARSMRIWNNLLKYLQE